MTKKLVLLSALGSVLGGFLFSASADPTFQWPDSSTYWRVLVNVNQYIEIYIRNHPQDFLRDRLVTDFAVFDVRPENRNLAALQYRKVRRLLQSMGMYVGTYVSGTTLVPRAKQKYYPPAGVALEDMPPSARYAATWPNEPGREIIDVTDTATRQALEHRIRELWHAFPAPLRFIDNMPPHPKMLPRTPWRATCQYIRELREMAASEGSKPIYNIAMHVSQMSDEDSRELIEAVGDGGVALEMPWSEPIRKDRQATDAERRRYRELLDSGMAVIMIPVSTPIVELTNWVQSWRKPVDHIYISIGFTESSRVAVLAP